MKNWHPDSWSKQARRMCDEQIWNVNNGWATVKGAIRFFNVSYRHPLIRVRAAKRFGRMLRAGKIHENLQEYYKNFPDHANN